MRRNPTIYDEAEAVRRYDSIIELPPDMREELTDFVLANTSVYHRLLDVGCGRGDFTLPILRTLRVRDIDFQYDGFDLSGEMVASFRKALEKDTDGLESRVNLWIGDAGKGLGGLMEDETARRYSGAFVTFVLHYFAEWRDILSNVHRMLHPEGWLVQAAPLGYYGCLADLFDRAEMVPKEHVDFWRTFFDEKRRLTGEEVWQHHFDVQTFSDVLPFLENEMAMQLSARKIFSWTKSLTFDDMLAWIIYSPVSTIAGGLTEPLREALREKMQSWLQRRRLDPTTGYDLPFSWELFIHVKARYNV